MKTVNVHEAKTHLSKLLGEVEQGECVIIARNGKPIARLTGLEPAGGRVLGRDAGLFEVPENFDDPLPEEIVRAFYS